MLPRTDIHVPNFSKQMGHKDMSLVNSHEEFNYFLGSVPVVRCESIDKNKVEAQVKRMGPSRGTIDMEKSLGR